MNTNNTTTLAPLASSDILDSKMDNQYPHPEEMNMNNKEEMDEETNISPEEKDLLEKSENSTPGSDDEDLARATLDSTDEDGEPLNEEVDATGSDLDVPGSEDDDENEAIGEEDEENNSYSLGGDRD